MPHRSLRLRLACAALTILLLPAAAFAQYFGRNKVQYKTFDFEVLETEHFDIYYYPAARDGVDIAARMAERWHARLERLLDHHLNGRQPLVLYASHVDFEQTNTIQGELGEGTGGVTEALRRRIILPMGGPLADTDHVIGHEIVHAFQFDVGNASPATAGANGIHRLPLWFIEGMAEYLSIGPVDPHTAMWLRDAARGEKLPTLRDLNNPNYFPYRWGQAFWAYVAGRWGDEVIGRMLRTGALTGDPEAAITGALGVSSAQLSADWHAAIRAAYAPVIASTTPPADMGRLAIRGRTFGGNLNVGPAISPDGRWIAFLSERDLFSIDLFVADASTGRVVHRLTSTASSPHYSSIQFIYSAGAWDAGSRQLAIATVTGGRPALALFDAVRGRRLREITIPGVDEIFNPTWSPDGRAIAFTAMTRGLTDLFVLDLSTGAATALTRDAYAEIQPSWSPDGAHIAFATDRFTSRLDDAAPGRYRLALIDPASGAVTEVGGFPQGKNINPQWSADARTLFFIADTNGIANLARIPAAGGVPLLLTNVMTGVTGITATSPALSVAAPANLAAFSVYDTGKYDIYTRELAAPPTAPDLRTLSAAPLPPTERVASRVAGLLNDARYGLPPADAAYESRKYRPHLGIEALGQPSFAVGANRFGAFVGGGLSGYFRDMLGDHALAGAVQLNSSVTGTFSPKDTAVQAAYTNQTQRWNWGVIGGQIPYLSGGFLQTVGTVDEIPAVIDQAMLLRQTERSVAATTAYPFNRAQRLELQAGVTQVSFDRIVRTQAFALETGQLLFDASDTTALADSLALGTSSAALVFDTSSFGATSPVQGARYRLEAAPTFGTVNYMTLLADYRRYLMPVSFYTIAGRIMHYGRYGTGGQDERLFPLYLGYPNLVRGYDVRSFNLADCAGELASRCPAFDQLTGSRLLVGNLELRVPLLRPFTGPSPGMYGPVPIEVALFADGGIAWTQGERPSIFGGTRDGIASAGVSFRANLLGIAIGEFAFARPFQRGLRGWVFQFNLSPGF